MSQKLDIIIFGATGFTGMHCIPYIEKLSKSDGRNLSWGVAGRSENKLKHILEIMSPKVDANLSETPIIICNVNDEDSLLKMAQQARLVINCVGPYVLYGEKVVDACLKAKTHHIDVSGEPPFMEKMEVTKNKIAEEKGVYVISACGLGSIPSDLGVVLLEQHFEGTLNCVTTYLQIGAKKNKSGTPTGSIINYGTWETFVHDIASGDELKIIRKQLFLTRLPTYKPILKPKFLPHTSKLVNGWVLPFPGDDRSVIRRTQKYFYEVENKRPVQVDTLFVLESFIQVLLFGFFSILFLLLSKFKIGQKLLLLYPELFSFGLVSKSQPSDETIENSWFEITIDGEGWSENLANKDDQFSKPCDKTMIAKVKGKNPAYGSTCICLVACAIIILTEKNKMAGAGKGGVYTPGAAFAKTSLVKLLNNNGVTFDIISSSK